MWYACIVLLYNRKIYVHIYLIKLARKWSQGNRCWSPSSSSHRAPMLLPLIQWRKIFRQSLCHKRQKSKNTLTKGWNKNSLTSLNAALGSLDVTLLYQCMSFHSQSIKKLSFLSSIGLPAQLSNLHLLNLTFPYNS